MISFSKLDSHPEARGELLPDLTSMLDILFILLVFFMLTAGAVFQSFDLVLPSSESDKLESFNQSKQLVLEIHQNHYSLDGQKLTSFTSLQALIAQSLKKKPQNQLIIAGDKHISLEKLLKVLTYLQSQGIEAANIARSHAPAWECREMVTEYAFPRGSVGTRKTYAQSSACVS